MAPATLSLSVLLIVRPLAGTSCIVIALKVLKVLLRPLFVNRTFMGSTLSLLDFPTVTASSILHAIILYPMITLLLLGSPIAVPHSWIVDVLLIRHIVLAHIMLVAIPFMFALAIPCHAMFALHIARSLMRQPSPKPNKCLTRGRTRL